MWTLSSRAAQALLQSRGMSVRATAYGQFGTMEIPISGGSVKSDAKSQVRRTASTSTNLSLWSRDPKAVLRPTGTEIQIDYGIVFPDVTEWVPLIRGLLSSTTRQRPIPANGEFPLALVDRSARVAEDRLPGPVQTVSGALTVTEIRRLIQDTLGTSVAVVDRTGSAQVAPVLDIERERWADGVEKLADSIAAECFFDPQGVGVIRPQPQLTDAYVWRIASGAGGTLLSKEDNLSRESIYNGVVVTGERVDGTVPVTATVWDTDPNSPTYYLGAFGRKPRFYSNPQLTTVAQCQAAGAALLARVRGINNGTKITAMVNPALEAGDVILLDDAADGAAKELHILDTVEVPLSPTAAQQLETRSLNLPAET